MREYIIYEIHYFKTMNLIDLDMLANQKELTVTIGRELISFSLNGIINQIFYSDTFS